MDLTRFPALVHLPSVRQAFASGIRIVLVEAGTGSGKSTALVRELARRTTDPLPGLGTVPQKKDQGWFLSPTGTVQIVEPRRLATRTIAGYIDRELRDPGESDAPPWSLAGYCTRFDTRFRDETRILAMTGGVFMRRLMEDPFLSGVECLVLDEFHERSLDTDFALAWSLGLMRELRPDLKLLILSATMDGAALSEHIDRVLGRRVCHVCSDDTKDQRRYPLDIRYSPHSARRDPVNAVVRGIRDALAEPGDMLVFLPGMREIRAVERALSAGLDPDKTILHVLHGEIDAGRQTLAMLPDSLGRRRIILSTTIAESSLTIEGLRIVVDSGLVNRPVHEHARGLTRLVTMDVSLSSADQRAGRAARTAPGIAWRLWSRAEERNFPQWTVPEIAQADLAPLLLGLAAAGAELPPDGDWLDPPPQAAGERARRLLTDLGALDPAGQLTETGKRMAGIPLHPRFARMLVAVSGDAVKTATAAALAALLEERDILPQGSPPWLEDRLALLAGGRQGQGEIVRRVHHTAGMLARRSGAENARIDPALAGELAALAWPERIARYTTQGWMLAGGGLVHAASATDTTMLVILDVETRSDGLHLRLAAALEESVFARLYPEGEGRSGLARERTMRVELNKDGRPRAFDELRFGMLVLSKKERQVTSPAERAALMCGGLAELARRQGGILPENARELVERISFVRGVMPECATDWPEADEQAVLAAGAVLAEGELAACRSLDQAREIDWSAVIRRLLGRQRMELIEREAPAWYETPAGTRCPIRYDRETGPTASVRLQQVFGLTRQPLLAGGRVPLALELLSPAGRPLQITRDIAGFWKGSYLEIRKDMRGRYPRHDWPEDGAAALPKRR